jgi:hypothetical protein
VETLGDDYRNHVSLLEVVHNLGERPALVLRLEAHSYHCCSLAGEEGSLGSSASALEGTAVVAVAGDRRSRGSPAAVAVADHYRTCLPLRRIGPKNRHHRNPGNSPVGLVGAAAAVLAHSHRFDPRTAEVGFAVVRVVGLVEPELRGELAGCSRVWTVPGTGCTGRRPFLSRPSWRVLPLCGKKSVGG